MRINELKIGDQIRFRYNNCIKTGYIWMIHGGDVGISEGRNIGGAQMWSIPESDVLSRIIEEPIEFPKPLIFNFSPTSSSYSLDSYSGRLEASMGGEARFFADGRERFETELKLPFAKCLGEFKFGKQYKVTIEEIP
jgi:hypothetical protein